MFYLGENQSDEVTMATTTLRKRAFIAVLFAVLNFLGAMGVIALEVDQRLVWLAILIAVGAGLYTLTLRCPKCETPMMKRTSQIFDIESTYWGGFTIPKHCSKCGLKF